MKSLSSLKMERLLIFPQYGQKVKCPVFKISVDIPCTFYRQM